MVLVIEPNVGSELRQRLVLLRRQIHAHPEYGFKEFETARLIAHTLKDLGAKVREGVARTGVVGEIGTGHPMLPYELTWMRYPLMKRPASNLVHGFPT